MKNSLLLIAFAFYLFSCHQSGKNKTEQQPDKLVLTVDTTQKETLPPLAEGEFSLSEKDFGELVELKGTPHPVDQIFRLSECEMIALDSMMIVKNLGNSNMFMAFSLPDFKFIKSFGRNGNGPDEFIFPSLVKDESKEFLCFIYENTNDHIYGVNKKCEIIRLPFALKKGVKQFNDKQPYGISSKEFLYVESINRGKALFHIVAQNDSAKTFQLKNLAFSDLHKNWASYIGNLGANGKDKRAVFAYKYFKRLMFYDLENNKPKTVFFDVPAKTKKGNDISMLGPDNVTHYWGMSAQQNYVYMLYSGRTPIDVSKELSKSPGYIYVEKYDWNGNPVAKYKLDHWGYFCVNEKENTIYLASTTEEQPFFSYQLP